MKKAKEKGSTVVRAVTLPVSVPLGTDPSGKSWTWESFNAAMTNAFRLSTDLANWCVRRLFMIDDSGSTKTPEAIKKWYGYKDANENFPRIAGWAGAMASMNIVTRNVQRKYIQDRFSVIIKHDSSLLTYRFPQPFPVHNASWKTGYADGDFPTVRMAIPGVGQVELRLKRRADFGRQLAMFRQLHDGTAKKGEAALYRDKKGVLLLKMVGHFPKKERTEAANVCFLHTDPNAMLVAEINGRSVTVTNGDHLKRAHKVIREMNDRHRVFLQRIGEDKKREVRMDRDQRQNVNKKVEDRCNKQRNRIDTAVKQIAAQVARFLERQKVGLVAYDDSIKTFLPDGFTWHALKTRITQLFVGEMGGEWIDGKFTHLKDETEKQEWLIRARAVYTTIPKVVAHKSRPRKKSHPAVSIPPKTM